MHALLLPTALIVAALSPSPREASARLAYDAPPDCPTEPEFRAAVSARGTDVAPGSPSNAARVLAVTIRRQADGFGGTFQARDRRGATGKRLVNGRSCTDVVDALALVTAIALADPSSETAATSAPPLPPAAEGRGEGAPAPPPATVEPLPAAAPRPAGLRGSTRVGPPRTETIQVGAGPLRLDLSRAAMLYGGAASGLVPSVFLPRYALAFTMASFVTTPEGQQRIMGLVYQLHVDLSGTGTYQSPDTRTEIEGAAFGIAMCQSPHYDSRGLVLLLCGEYGGGYLNLQTKGLDGAMIQSKNVGFGQVSGVVDVQYQLGGGFVVGVRIGGSLKLGDITAERADGSRIFSSSIGSAYALLGAGYRF
jgi:hypothetical protein